VGLGPGTLETPDRCGAGSQGARLAGSRLAGWRLAGWRLAGWRLAGARLAGARLAGSRLAEDGHAPLVWAGEPPVEATLAPIDGLRRRRQATV
jgi:hypothetical protein